MNEYLYRLSERNYNFELLKEGAELHRDLLLDNPDNMSGFDKHVDKWWSCRNLKFEVEFLDSTAVIKFDAEVELDRDGDYSKGEFTVYEIIVQQETYDYPLTLEQCDLISNFINF